LKGEISNTTNILNGKTFPKSAERLESNTF
jgi:hypothetical protein